MDNLELYNTLRSVPDNAKRPIMAGRLKGKTDINPMWRIKALTERFGPCGQGWGYIIDRLWTEGGANGERTANAQISLWYRLPDGSKSEPVPGIGGNMLVAKEKNGLYTSDECYKMALTDAISVSAKALGVGADVYWDADRTKYTAVSQPQQQNQTNVKQSTVNPPLCADCGCVIQPYKQRTAQEMAHASKEKFGRVLCMGCANDELERYKVSQGAAS